ncbi:MAG TPA: vWA domain-containing protein [Actinophytocola sp.]|uniref:vWA domain-containing protein n=1 Tax=Actinophytocola sp. TaxID=1872138 RepID=UPI002DB6674F|nr:vWA domain-containing protein [Actinophytocola sp.]HEU5475614.1 vWA domain-containing protein [Actinophytocola sp.]
MRAGPVLPIYVVCDHSFSMLDHIDTVTDSLLELHRTCGLDPLVAERTRFCLIGFSESPEILLPLGGPDGLATISGGVTRAASNFGPAFSFLRETITRDVAVLRRNSHEVCRPVVFFLSDGQPTDPLAWPAAHARLVDPAWADHPDIVGFGVGEADPVTINRICTSGAYLGRNGADLGAALMHLLSISGPSVPSRLSTAGRTEATMEIH